MSAPQESSPGISPQAVISFELSLGFVAILVCFATDQKMPDWHPTIVNTLWALAATAPMLAFVWYSLRSTWAPLQKLRSTITEFLPMLVSDRSTLAIFLIGISAGVGEELLFRGLIQPSLETAAEPIPGLLLTSLLFGCVHALSVEYFVVATLTGLVLGLLLMVTGGLWAPIVCHSLYDIVTLYWILQWKPDSGANRTPGNASV